MTTATSIFTLISTLCMTRINGIDWWDVLSADLTCCPKHTTEATCLLESGSNCVWFSDPNDPIVVLSGSQCLGAGYAKCKADLGINACCSTGCNPEYVPPAPPICGPAPTPLPTPQPTAEPCKLGQNYFFEGKPCYISGDPHTITFNGAHHDFQGQPATLFDGVLKNQYYYIHACAGSDAADLPFAILGTHYQWSTSSVSGLDYTTIILYDNTGDEYYVFLSASLHSWTMKNIGITTTYDDNNMADMTSLESDVETSIGNRFSIKYTQSSKTQANAILTIDGVFILDIYMQAQSNFVDERYKMHYVHIIPPLAFKCHICGLCGDYKRPKTGGDVEQMETCDGRLIDYRSGLNADRTPEAYDPDAWTWERGYVANSCNEIYDVTDNNGDDFVYNDPCDDPDFAQKVYEQCDVQNAALATCCEKIGGGFCDDLLNDCYIDACAEAGGVEENIVASVEQVFNRAVNMVCRIPDIGDQMDNANAPVVPGCTATVYANGDNIMTIYLSTDGGKIFEEINFETDSAKTTTNHISAINENTVIKFQIEDEGIGGGFISTIDVIQDVDTTKRVVLYTNNPLTTFDVKQGDSSNLQYTIGGGMAHHASDAYWIWDGNIENTMIFQINFSNFKSQLVDLGCVAPDRELEFQCESRFGPESYDIETGSLIACNTGETLVSCGIDGKQLISGTYIDPLNNNVCRAKAESSTYSVTAVARCCIFPEGTINSVTTTVTTTPYEIQGIQCPTGTLTGCQVEWVGGEAADKRGGSLQGSYTGPNKYGSPPTLNEWISTGNQCNGEAYPGATVNIGAQCIDFNDGYSLDCKTMAQYTSAKGFGDSSVCENGYQLIACNSFSVSETMDSFFLNEQGFCYVQQDDQGEQYANGICCKLTQNINPAKKTTAIKEEIKTKQMIQALHGNIISASLSSTSSLQNGYIQIIFGIISMVFILCAGFYYYCYYNGSNKSEYKSIKSEYESISNHNPWKQQYSTFNKV